jgi:hypothetical protein
MVFELRSLPILDEEKKDNILAVMRSKHLVIHSSMEYVLALQDHCNHALRSKAWIHAPQPRPNLSRWYASCECLEGQLKVILHNTRIIPSTLLQQQQHGVMQKRYLRRQMNLARPSKQLHCPTNVM